MRVLIFVASLPYSEPAVLFGGLIARLTQSSITLLHATPPDKDLSDAENTLAQARALLPSVAVNTRIYQSPSIKGILAEIHSGNYDLVVLQARQTLRLRDRLRDTVDRVIAKESPISVLIVKQGRPNLERILICTGGQDTAEPVIETGARLAQAAQAQVSVLHVATPVPRMYAGLDAMAETLPELLQTDTPLAQHLNRASEIMAQHQINATLMLRRGEVVGEILQEALAGDYDLLLIGASAAKKGLKEWMLGNATRRIVDTARCPVLVVKRAEAEQLGTDL
jgi:nucleotide-binding universal stress UspA family protein